MRARPISPSLVVEELAGRIAASGPGSWTREVLGPLEPSGSGRDPVRTADVVLRVDDPGHPALVTDV